MCEPNTQHGDDHALHGINAVVGNAISAANDSFTIAEHVPENAVVETRVPSRRNTRSPVAVVDGKDVGFTAALDRNIREGGIKDVAIFSGRLLLLNVVQAVDNRVTGVVIGDKGLLLMEFVRCGLPAIPEAVR